MDAVLLPPITVSVFILISLGVGVDCGVTVYLHLHTCNVGTSLQRISPRCQVPVKAVRGVRGADTRQMIMSDTAMLQMYMLEVVLSSGRLVDIIIIGNLDIVSEELMEGLI